jgi:hypothetical protein
MTTPRIDPKSIPDRRSPAYRAFVASGLWLRGGFVGASAFAIGLVMLFTGEASPVTALVSAIAGGLVAVYAWRQSWLVLNRADIAEAGQSGPARAIAFGNRVESAATR